MIALYSLLLLAWPLASFMTFFMFDAPSAGGVVTYALAYSTLAYGPVYLIALVGSILLKGAGRADAARKLWHVLCGGNLVIWALSLLILLVACDGRFACG